MSEQLILVTAGGLGRETAEAARASGRYDVLGFLDDDATSWGAIRSGVKVLGAIDRVVGYPQAQVVVCAGKGSVRQRIVARLCDLGVSPHRYATVVDPSVSVGESCVVGAGSILLANCALTADVTIGRHVVCMPNATLTHDDVLADFATLSAGVSLGGTVTIGSRAYLGMNSAVRENLSVGPDSVLGMGAVALHDIPPSQTWVGVPAQPLQALTGGDV